MELQDKPGVHDKQRKDKVRGLIIVDDRIYHSSQALD